MLTYNLNASYIYPVQTKFLLVNNRECISWRQRLRSNIKHIVFSSLVNSILFSIIFVLVSNSSKLRLDSILRPVFNVHTMY